MRIFLATALFCCGLAAYAHSTSLFAEYDGNILKGRAYSGTHGIAGGTVTVSTLDDQVLGTAQTDDNGNFQFRPESTVSVKCVLKLADGHGARCVVKVDEDNHHRHGDAGHGSELEELHQEIDELKHMIHEQSHHNGIRDIIGGIGYIVGIAGVVMFLKNKKPAQ